MLIPMEKQEENQTELGGRINGVEVCRFTRGDSFHAEREIIFLARFTIVSENLNHEVVRTEP